MFKYLFVGVLTFSVVAILTANPTDFHDSPYNGGMFGKRGLGLSTSPKIFTVSTADGTTTVWSHEQFCELALKSCVPKKPQKFTSTMLFNGALYGKRTAEKLKHDAEIIHFVLDGDFSPAELRSSGLCRQFKEYCPAVMY